MSSVTDYEFAALLEDYRRASRQISGLTRLQYQLCALTLLIAGAILAVLTTSVSTPRSIYLLVFPPVFFAVVLIQLYLHSEIKSHSRYINFALRSRVEDIINAGAPPEKNHHVAWDWDEHYAQSYPIARFIIRSLGHTVYLLPFALALGALSVYSSLEPFPWPQAEQTWFLIDELLALFALGLIVFVGLINEYWWRSEKRTRQQ